MYVHIGKQRIIRSDQIIAILNLDNLLKEITLKEILQQAKVEKSIDISKNNRKSLLIVKEQNEKIRGYITNISSSTLAKRIKVDIIECLKRKEG